MSDEKIMQAIRTFNGTSGDDGDAPPALEPTNLAKAKDQLPPVKDPRHDTFAREFVVSRSGTRAAQAAGIGSTKGSSKRMAYDLLRRPEVQARIAFYEQAADVSRDEALGLIATIARFRPAEFITIHDDGGWSIDLRAAKEHPELLDAISEIGYDRWGRPKVKFAHLDARKELAKIKGLTTQLPDASNADEVRKMQVVQARFAQILRDDGPEGYRAAYRQCMENEFTRKYAAALPENPEEFAAL
jgi:hypothetical protein